MEPSDLADSFPMSPVLLAALVVLEVRTDPVAPAAGEAQDPDLAWCRAAAELSSSVVDRAVGLEAVLAEEEVVVAAVGCFARLLIESALAFTTATRIRYSTQSHIR